MTGLVTAASIREAAVSLQGVALRTPLLPAAWLADSFAASVRLKCENLQRAGAFKIRGAYTMLSRLDPRERSRGVITYSSGNHAQALALAASLFRVPSVVVMPTTAPRVKMEGAKRLGAEVVLEGTTSIDRKLRAEAIAAERGFAIVPPFDHPDIIAGQGTVGLEIVDDWPDVDAVLVPIGGGGLISGVAAAVKALRPGCAVIGVEPENAASMKAALDAGELTTIDVRPTVADGLAPVRAGELTFAHVKALVDDVVTVTDDAILDATRRLLAEARLVVEFSGAASLAALLSGAWRPGPRSAIALVLSGGNLDFERAAPLLTG